jgi:hypothetical protein
MHTASSPRAYQPLDEAHGLIAAIHAEVPYAAVTCAKTPRISPSDGFDTSVLRQLIGHIEENSLREGIHKTVALYREIAAR